MDDDELATLAILLGFVSVLMLLMVVEVMCQCNEIEVMSGMVQ